MTNIVGIGTDIVECLRIAQMIERHGELFIDRVYTADETRYCQRRNQATQHFAARWAAKEAVLKAIRTGWVRGISWRDVEVVSDGGPPSIALHGGVREVADQIGIRQILITMSHCRSHAVAHALALVDDDFPELASE